MKLFLQQYIIYVLLAACAVSAGLASKFTYSIMKTSELKIINDAIAKRQELQDRIDSLSLQYENIIKDMEEDILELNEELSNEISKDKLYTQCYVPDSGVQLRNKAIKPRNPNKSKK